MTAAVPDLDELIVTVRESTPNGNELDQLAAAVSHAATVARRADQLLSYFMTAAHRAGVSGRQIGDRFRTTPKFMPARFLNRADLAKPWEGFVHPDVRPSLDDLIAESRDSMPAGTAALDAVGAAAVRGRELRALTDELVGHFVGRAREAGASWAQILQATNFARPRTESPFRKTSQFMRATITAEAEGIRLGHGHVDSADLLWGVLLDDRATSVRLLESPEPIRMRLATRSPAGPRRERIPLTEVAVSAVTKRAPAEARKLGHEYIGTGHLLLALAAGAESYARAILDEYGVEYDRLRATLIDSGEPSDRHDEY